METPDRPPAVPQQLEYGSPELNTAEFLSVPMQAFCFCLPGSLCWLMFFSRMVRLPFSFSGVFPSMWLLALVVAPVSIIYFRRRPKSWPVTACLVINIAGLVFSFVAVGLFIYLSGPDEPFLLFPMP